jgi:hypothetical protein
MNFAGEARDGSVLHITTSLKGRISPTCLGYSWRCSCHLFKYHRGSSVEWVATHNSDYLKWQLAPFYKRGVILMFLRSVRCNSTHTILFAVMLIISLCLLQLFSTMSRFVSSAVSQLTSVLIHIYQSEACVVNIHAQHKTLLRTNCLLDFVRRLG